MHSFAPASSVASPERLGSLFCARSVAIVGASETSNWARNLMGSIALGSGVTDLRFVHPKYDEQFGFKTVPSLVDLDDTVELAFVMVGPTRVEQVLRDASSAGVKSAVVLAAGYGELGPEGRMLQERLTEAARELDITVLGPNTIGFINAVDGIMPWAVASSRPPLAGPVAAVFESGSMARATYEFAQAHAIGSTIWASLGNSAVVNSMDVLEYLIDDER
jgi:acyl-CoA synthetase (NDP forming)